MPPIRKTKNFGLIKAIHSDVNPPLNTKIIWYDENPSVRKHKYYDVDAGQWLLLGGGSSGSLDGNFAYMAFATDCQGSNFSLNFDRSKETWAIITSETELTTAQLVPSLFEHRWTFFCRADQSGSVEVDEDFDINSDNPLSNSVITEFRNSLAEPPNYVLPQSLLSSSETGIYEVGTSLAVDLGLTYQQNDAGDGLNFELIKNGITLQLSSNVFSYTDSIVLEKETIEYQSTIDYAQGAIKNNPEYGFPDDRGRIMAGSVSSSIKTIEGEFLIWYGALANIPSISSTVRAISNNVWGSQSQITLNTGTTNKKFVAAVPTTINNSASLSAQDITNNVAYSYNFIRTIDVELPNGSLQEYRIYALELDNSYPTNAEHVIQTQNGN